MIQILGSLLIWASLGVGTLAAVTAYRPLLKTVADSPAVLTLGMPVGRQPADEEGESNPLFEPPMAITPDMIETLSAANVKRVGVKEFSFPRWNERYWFLASLAGLIVGAVLVRRGTSASDIAAEQSEHTEDPIDALAQAAVEIDKLATEVASPDFEPTKRLQKINEVLEQVRRTHLDTFTSGGPRLTRQLGLSGFARLMDAYASAERKLNRAWSAAVDNNEAESLDCLRDGQDKLREAMKRLGSLQDT